MKVTYIFHSGFLVETGESYYLFDYWKGELPRLDPHKPVVVFSSHAHQDHYEPAVFGLLKDQGMEDIYAVLGKDIPRERYPEDIPCLRAMGHKSYTLPHGETVETLQSTDAGVAFLLTCPEGVVYHAGDLSNWSWEGEPEEDNAAMAGMYRREIGRLTDRHIDLAFVPMDSRLGKYTCDGLEEFLRTVPGAKVVHPMHHWDRRDLIAKFVEEHPQYRDVVVDPEM